MSTPKNSKVANKTSTVTKSKRAQAEPVATFSDSAIVDEIIRRVEAREEFWMPRVRLTPKGDSTLSVLSATSRPKSAQHAGLTIEPIDMTGPPGECEPEWFNIENAPLPPYDVTPERLKSLPLQPEMIPKPIWGENLRKHVSRPEWDVIRRTAYKTFGNRCAICRADTRQNCHEDWEFDDMAHVLRLRGLLSLCDPCHNVKHLGNARRLERMGVLVFDTVIRHFQTVNSCSRYEFRLCEIQGNMIWAKRSRHKWTVDFGDLLPTSTVTDE